VVLARRRRGLEAMGEEELSFRIPATPPVNTGTMAEAAGIRIPTPEQLEPEVEVLGRPRREGGW
jgi:hypothetical protein